MDCTIVSVLHQDGTPWPDATHEDGVRAEGCRNEKEGTYPEFENSGRAVLVVASMEVGGRWGAEGVAFLRMLAPSRAAKLPRILRRQAELGYFNRWSAILACAAQRAVGASFYDKATQINETDARVDATPLPVEIAGEARFESGPVFSRLPAR